MKKLLSKGYYKIKHYNHEEIKIMYYNGERFEMFPNDPSINDEIETYQKIEVVSSPVEPEVIKKNADGLLPCPFCGEDEWKKLGETYFLQHNYDCFIRNTSEPLISKTILRNNTESIWWNKRAGREPQSK